MNRYQVFTRERDHLPTKSRRPNAGQMAKWHQIKMVVQSQKEGERQSSAFLVTVTKHTQELEMCYTPVSGQEENWI